MAEVDGREQVAEKAPVGALKVRNDSSSSSGSSVQPPLSTSERDVIVLVLIGSGAVTTTVGRASAHCDRATLSDT